MNKTLWKLDRIGERLWILATLAATQAAALANEGKGIAIVADETRNLANKIIHAVEKAALEGGAPDGTQITPLAFEINLLAFNGMIEAFRLCERGKEAAVFADEIRNLATDISRLLDQGSNEKPPTANPWPANVMTSVMEGHHFLQFCVNGIAFYEPLDNIEEVCTAYEQKDGKIKLRSMEIPVIDGCKMLGVTSAESTYVILQTPWAEQNKRFAVAADIAGMHVLPIGKPIPAPPDMPFANHVRECWENENGEPFYFMDWTAMA